METDSDFGKGVNYTGDIIKLWINGRDKQNQPVELRLILKIALRDIFTRKLISIERSYQCESFMYETVLASFTEMQETAKVEDRFESYPKFYASSTKTMEELIVLENLTSFKVGERLETLSFHQARMLAKEIGKLHALSFVLRRRNPQLFREYSEKIRNEKLEEEEYPQNVIRAISTWNTRYLKLFDSNKLYETVRTLPSKFYEMYERYYRFDPEDEYGVIGHCDLWSTNLLFSQQEVRIIDWQTSRVCSPAVDLSLILFICCDGEVRNKHKQDLIEAYYDSCSETLLQFGEDPNVVFPRAILQEHLKTYSGYGFCFALRTMVLVAVPEEEIPNIPLFQSYIEVIDMYATINLNSNVFDKRVRDILTDYVSYGYDM
ncbi:hypothetical protein FQR65_LT15942 [Abscondita terminalis]|nr:hypothetical protein FQR65_LT15942 [Abscondita terminalis]